MRPRFTTRLPRALGRSAVKDGILDPAGYQRWADQHQDALRALPPTLQSKFANAASASNALDQAATVRKAALDQYQKSTVGKFLNLSNPQDVTRTVGGIFEAQDGVQRMSRLAAAVKNNPDGQQGLRKAVADYILSKAKGTTESGTSGTENLNAGTFQKLIRNNGKTLKAAGFSDEEVGLMHAIGADMQRSQRTLSATRLAGQSNTGARPDQHTFRTQQNLIDFPCLEKWSLAAGAAGVLAARRARSPALWAAWENHVVRGLRNAGIAKSSLLIRDAMYNPELARALLEKSPSSVGVASHTNLRKALANMSVFGLQSAGQP